MSSFILVLNCGSSSIKFSVIEPSNGSVLINGIVGNIQTPECILTWRIADNKTQQKIPNADYKLALQTIIHILHAQDVIQKLIAVGHRVVHGGERFTQSTLINDDVIDYLQTCIRLAPLHNPANLEGIAVAKKLFPELPQVAVFDTAFHQSLPQYAYLYPLPKVYYQTHKIRRYGFHGTSYRYVMQQALQQLALPANDNALIIAHLGNGCSACAILNSLSIDTTMGMTPLEGLIMGTRTGDIDPGISTYLANICGYSLSEINELFNKKSGLLGISGLSMDMRALQQAAQEGNQDAALAINMFCYRLAKYIGALAITLPKLDALIFTGGIGENSALVRDLTLKQLKILGFLIAEQANNENGLNHRGLITTLDSTPAVVIATNEELMIAQDTLQLTENN